MVILHIVHFYRAECSQTYMERHAGDNQRLFLRIL